MTPERREKIEQVARAREGGFVVVLEDIHDPHNAEAIMRTCDAFGVQDVWLIFEKEESFNPRRVGKLSSSSANKWLTFRKFKTTRGCIDALREAGYVIVATALGGETDTLYQAKLAHEKIALVVGNERDGVSEELLAAADAIVKIPMRGFVESLNVSVAAALCIAEITRQREVNNITPRLSSVDLQALLRYFEGK